MKIDAAYCSDKYQYTMGKSFYQDGMESKIAIFNLFYRQAPDQNNWAVVSGISEALEMIRELGSKDEAFFEKFIPGDEYKEYRKYLSTMRFTGNVYAMREGEIAFPHEPILTVEAPIIEAQVLETPLLCIMNHQMAVATKASRVTRSTKKPVSEFGSRRAHGPWAAIYGGKAAYIGGCESTSNVLSSEIFGAPSTGTMAHSYVTSFGSTIHGEYRAFDSYIKTHKSEPIILLIDTYDTVKCGIKNAIKALKNNNIDDSYPHGYGIRLDSGDLAYLSLKCRDELDKAGLTKCKIIATNSLDEYIIKELERQESAIDSYGVGDAIATSKHTPNFGCVYKLVQIDGKPVLKRSEDKIKLINPGFQITYRIIQNNFFKADITCLRDDSLTKKIEAGEEFTVQHEFDETKRSTFLKGSYSYKILQQPVMQSGEITAEDIPIQQRREYYLSNLNSMNPTERRIINPHFYKVDISDDLYDLKMNIINNLIEELKEFDMNNEISHIVVDMLYDFIDGSLACRNGDNAVNETIRYINQNPSQNVLYVADYHPSDHCSFVIQGGTWPVHCVEGSRGSEIHESFYKEIEHQENRPDPARNIFYKGRHKDQEQYSAYQAENNLNEAIWSIATKKVVISGIATEFCVKSTVTDLLNNGFEVSILTKALAYVDKENHLATLKELEERGVKLI